MVATELRVPATSSQPSKGVFMTSQTIYHYVYRITNTVEKKHYYGKRSSKCDPKQDLGKIYFSSSRDKEFLIDQKENPQNYRYKIVGIFKTAASAVSREIKLHIKFSVGSNLTFYNKSRQTAIGFDRTGCLQPEGFGEKHSRDISGEKHPFFGKTHSEFTKNKISKSLTGIVQSSETKLKRSVAMKGKKKSEMTKEKMRKPKSDSHRESMRKPKEIVECPHCNKLGGHNLMTRYHFDNCRNVEMSRFNHISCFPYIQ